jgi:hypothetical protein
MNYIVSVSNCLCLYVIFVMFVGCRYGLQANASLLRVPSAASPHPPLPPPPHPPPSTTAQATAQAYQPTDALHGGVYGQPFGDNGHNAARNQATAPPPPPQYQSMAGSSSSGFSSNEGFPTGTSGVGGEDVFAEKRMVFMEDLFLLSPTHRHHPHNRPTPTQLQQRHPLHPSLSLQQPPKQFQPEASWPPPPPQKQQQQQQWEQQQLKPKPSGIPIILKAPVGFGVPPPLPPSLGSLPPLPLPPPFPLPPPLPPSFSASGDSSLGDMDGRHERIVVDNGIGDINGGDAADSGSVGGVTSDSGPFKRKSRWSSPPPLPPPLSSILPLSSSLERNQSEGRSGKATGTWSAVTPPHPFGCACDICTSGSHNASDGGSSDGDESERRRHKRMRTDAKLGDIRTRYALMRGGVGSMASSGADVISSMAPTHVNSMMEGRSSDALGGGTDTDNIVTDSTRPLNHDRITAELKPYDAANGSGMADNDDGGRDGSCASSSGVFNGSGYSPTEPSPSRAPPLPPPLSPSPSTASYASTTTAVIAAPLSGSPAACRERNGPWDSASVSSDFPFCFSSPRTNHAASGPWDSASVSSDFPFCFSSPRTNHVASGASGDGSGIGVGGPSIDNWDDNHGRVLYHYNSHRNADNRQPPVLDVSAYNGTLGKHRPQNVSRSGQAKGPEISNQFRIDRDKARQLKKANKKANRAAVYAAVRSGDMRGLTKQQLKMAQKRLHNEDMRAMRADMKEKDNLTHAQRRRMNYELRQQQLQLPPPQDGHGNSSRDHQSHRVAGQRLHGKAIREGNYGASRSSRSFVDGAEPRLQRDSAQWQQEQVMDGRRDGWQYGALEMVHSNRSHRDVEDIGNFSDDEVRGGMKRDGDSASRGRLEEADDWFIDRTPSYGLLSPPRAAAGAMNPPTLPVSWTSRSETTNAATPKGTGTGTGAMIGSSANPIALDTDDDIPPYVRIG